MNARNPELQRLLASLTASGVSLGHPNGQENFQQSFVPGLNTSAHEANNAAPANLRGRAPTHTNQKAAQHNDLLAKPEVARSRSATPSTPVPDASSITTWPAALKHVNRYLIDDEKATSRIKHLIAEQHKHEEQWWAQRQALVVKHSGRAGNQTKVADLLRELGGLAVPMVEVDEAADKNELEAFDKKVYKSLVQMAADFDGQLRKLGVPFYAIKHELVLSDGAKDGASSKGKLDKGELRELQKRMLQHLEDLVSDD